MNNPSSAFRTPAGRLLQTPVVLLAKGRYPTHSVPLHTLESAGTLICTDGSADTARERGLIPDIIIGDMDSIRGKSSSGQAEWVPLDGQDDTDLEKALDWCSAQGVREIFLVGATGARDDHSLVAYFALFRYARSLSLILITDHFTIRCIDSECTFPCHPGQRVSLFALEPLTAVSTAGLQYPLNAEPLGPGGRAVSNSATDYEFSVYTSGKLLVLQAHPR